MLITMNLHDHLPVSACRSPSYFFKLLMNSKWFLSSELKNVFLALLKVSAAWRTTPCVTMRSPDIADEPAG